MADLQNWIRHGDEMRRPLLANSDLPKAEKIVIVGGGYLVSAVPFVSPKNAPSCQYY